MHAEIPTKLSLYDFARRLGISTLHFAGVDMPGLPEFSSQYCQQPWIQYNWQDAGRIGREDVASAIAAAEAAIEEHLGFRLLPTYEVNERREVPRPYHPENVNYNGLSLAGYNMSARTRWGWVVEGGSRTTTLLTIVQQGGHDIVWSDDSYWQIGTVVVDATGITDPEEIRVFFPTKNADPTWEIRPATVSINATTHQATVTFRRECAVEPDLWDALVVEDADGGDDNDFLSMVDVYRVYTNPSAMATLLWQPFGSPCGSCPPNSTCSVCGFSSQAGCFMVRDSETGRLAFQPATWDADTLSFTRGDFLMIREADQMNLNYLAGYQDQSLATPRKTMSVRWQQAVAYYAAALLERPPCDCNPDYWERWREDLSTTVSSFGQGGDIVRVSRQDLENPFGTRRGMVYAWKQVMQGDALGNPILAR